MADEAKDSPSEKAEAARIRRRWITLGEVLGVAAVAISGLGLYNSWSERRADEQKAVRQDVREEAAARSIALLATPADEGRRLAIAPLRQDQPIQGQTIRFPAALGIAPIDTAGDPRIESGWFSRQLKKAFDDRQKIKGDARLPVLVTTRFLSDNDLRSASALYDVGYAIDEGGLLGGSRIRLKGISLIAGAATPARLDALWKQRLPPAKAD